MYAFANCTNFKLLQAIVYFLKTTLIQNIQNCIGNLTKFFKNIYFFFAVLKKHLVTYLFFISIFCKLNEASVCNATSGYFIFIF
jgi:hypothetical protein